MADTIDPNVGGTNVGNVAAPATAAVDSMPAAELTRFWWELMREQTRQNQEVMARLAAVRDWREALEIQGNHLRESMSRMSRGLCRQIDVAGGLTSRLLTVATDDLKQAA